MTANDPATLCAQGFMRDVTAVGHACGFTKELSRMYLDQDVLRWCRENTGKMVSENIYEVVRAAAKAVGGRDHGGAIQIEFGLLGGAGAVHCFQVTIYCLFSRAVVISLP